MDLRLLQFVPRYRAANVQTKLMMGLMAKLGDMPFDRMSFDRDFAFFDFYHLRLFPGHMIENEILAFFSFYHLPPFLGHMIELLVPHDRITIMCLYFLANSAK